MKNEIFEFPEKFKINLARSRVKAPKGFKEEDLKNYKICGIEDIHELLNATFYDFENKKNALPIDRNSDLWGGSSADISVEIIDDKDETEISVYRLVKRWVKNKR